MFYVILTFEISSLNLSLEGAKAQALNHKVLGRWFSTWAIHMEFGVGKGVQQVFLRLRMVFLAYYHFTITLLCHLSLAGGTMDPFEASVPRNSISHPFKNRKQEVM
jgi:hypothetical protein